MKTYQHLLASNKLLNNYVAVKLFHTLNTKLMMSFSVNCSKVYFSKKTGVNKTIKLMLTSPLVVEEPLYKKNHLASRWGLI